MPVLFCHGLESSPQGRKVQALRAAGLEVIAPDFQGQNLAARVATLLPVLRAHPDALVIGSSYGGITALCAAILHSEAGGSVRGLLLCAPALGRYESPADALRLYPPAPTVILHGRRDSVVPVQVSEDFAAAHPEVRLELVDDDHRLNASLERMLALTHELLAATTPQPAA
ncbi:MAG: alpha/beta hydrolase [Nannocystis sp.]|nr:alpha/beta hydrolase [Nannocystis sp.]MBA3545945.1 alpha/beta hydrolase [Nannocystis sp.]